MDHISSHIQISNPDQNAEVEKFAIDAAEFPIDGTGPLPETYGDNKLVLLVRDPEWFFAYWEYTDDRVNRLREQFGADVWEKGVLVMRVYDVTDLRNDGLETAPYFDIDLQDRAVRSWYVKVGQPGHSFVAEVGIRLPDGRFLALLRSNRIRLPFGQISDMVEAEWMAVDVLSREEWTRISGVENIGKGSAEFSKAMAQRWEFLRSVFSLASSMLSMPSLPSSMPSSFSSSNVSSSNVWRVPDEIHQGGKRP